MLEPFVEGTKNKERECVQLIKNSRTQLVSLTLSSKVHLYRKLVCAQMGGRSVESKNNDTGIGEGFGIFLLFAPEKKPEDIKGQTGKAKFGVYRGLVFPEVVISVTPSRCAAPTIAAESCKIERLRPHDLGNKYRPLIFK